ncbi:hypothetical protein Patl1_20743 [Pistacia atlantica]|uniref:Uncharacterized protein n=1 Tax=Pistacia atlantica TaxID=434234 RepID=A0ACC1BKF2_9ROSI|nr:hypothetical protein Patl1_20743 [Pistacia atlantica]
MSLSDEVLERAHRYVLFDTTVTEPFLQMHLEELKQSNKNLERNHNLLQKTHANNFATWLKEKVSFLTSICEDGETLKWLANGPRNHAMSYNGYVINGQRHHREARYKLDQEWQKHYVLKEMGALWRTSKSRLVSNIKMAKNEDERMALKPDNIKSISEWKKFVEEKLGPRFKGKSEEMKNRRKKQTSYTGGPRGYARMIEDIKKKIGKQVVSRVEVWIEAHKKKNGEPINTKTAEAIEKLQQMGNDSSLLTPTNLREDVITKVLGPDKGGHVRGLGRDCENNPHKTKCKLLDWSGSTEVIAEGRFSLDDPKALVHHVPIGPNAMRVWIDIAKVPNAFLWRSASEMVFVEDLCWEYACCLAF